MKKLFCIMALAGLASIALAAPPLITNTTVWHDTAFTGPYVISSVIRDTTSALSDTLLRYCYNPGPGDDPAGWGAYSGPDSLHADTMYFHVPVIPAGLETPVKIGYAVWARNVSYEETSDPAAGYRSFVNLVYSPRFTNVSPLTDTFYNGPLVVKAQVSVAYGHEVSSDLIYTDLTGGVDYPRDSIGADGFYYYAIPRFPGNAQTPIKAFWYLSGADSLGNTGSYPLKRDTLNHFVLIDPKPSNVLTVANTSQTGPFTVAVDYKAEGAVINDSLWLDNGSGLTAYPRDSVGTTDPNRYYYTIPQQSQPVVTPVNISWYLKATDSITGNYTYVPALAPSVPYVFHIYDRTPPVLAGVTMADDAPLPGPQQVMATSTDTSGIYQIRLYYRTKPNEDTTWQYLPMFATGTPNQYKTTLPFIGDGMLVQYYVSAIDGARDEGGNLLRNVALFPAGGPLTPWQYFVGSHPYRLLLVNDELPANNYEASYISALDTTGVLYGYWDNRKASVLPSLRNFDNLVWFTGEDSLTTLGQADRDSLVAFLDRGGNLLLSSKNLGQNIGDTSVFYQDYLKAQYYSNRSTQFSLKGQSAYPISNGPVDTLTVIGAIFTRSIDVITPRSGADSVFTFNSTGRCGVVRCSTAAFKTVYSTLPLEGLAKSTNGRLSRTYFIARCLRYFGITAFYKVDDAARPVLAGSDLRLYQAYPNPFRTSAMITYQLPAPARISLRVYNIAGQLVKTLVDQQMAEGRHTIHWNGHDDAGTAVTSGIYFYRLTTGNQQITSKLILVR